jgi:hypothetical protein
MHLIPHLLVTLFRIRVTFLINLFRRKITPLQTEAFFSLGLTPLLTGPILAACRTLLFSEAIVNRFALVEVFFTPLHSVVTFVGVQRYEYSYPNLRLE